MPFFVRQHRQLVKGLLWIAHDAVQQSFPMPAHALERLPAEQIRGIFEKAIQPVFRFG
ncbi:hypothetical protein D3C86_2216930 [compost metagenome]